MTHYRDGSAVVRLHIVDREKPFLAVAAPLPPAVVAGLQHLHQISSLEVQFVVFFSLQSKY